MSGVAGEITGARESNAGDEFHVLWATRKVLGLLDDCTGLRLVSMEDLHPRTLEGVHPAQLLGVDLTELYGGDTLTSASSIVVTQLKYSPRNPQTSWTAARLAQRRRTGDPKTSVVGRLADVLRAISTQLDRDDLVARLSLRLVSNQPAGPNIAAALDASARWLEFHPGPANRASLLAALSARDRAEIERILDATGLPSRQATDFLRVFSLDVGQGSRSAQDVQLTEALGTHVGADLEYHALALKDLVRARALPEGEGEPIRRETVLAALHVPGMEAMLPAPSHFERPDTVLPTPDPARILAALDAAPAVGVLAHGGAGVGKTTSVLELERLLPDGSVTITFDCFAAGGYLKQTEARHTPQRALLQLCNEIAMRCRVPMLVVRPHDDADLWRMFQARVDQAAAQLRSAGARLVIVIDAADNSVWAARRSQQASFVPDLWDLRVPEGAGLVVTARTGRLDQIAAPADLADVELRGFDETASAANLRLRFPHADADQALAFHERSRMNPRVQFYVLDASRPGSADTVEQAVEQAELTPEDIFDDLWSAAVDEALDPDAAREALANLLCLSRQTSIGRLAAVCGWPAHRTRRFASALYPGLRIEDEALELRDEDFEKYLTDKFDEQEMRDAHGRLADLFAADPQDRYAATALAGHLSEAARTDDLIDLALGAGLPDGVTDPVARLGVYQERLRLAMRAATAAGRSADTAKLVVLAAGAAKSDRAMTKVVLERPGLALRHGDPEVVSIIWNDPSNVAWFGPIHMRLAAIRASDGEFAAAEEHLRHARAWLIRRQEEDKTTWDLRAADVAAGSEAVRVRSGWAAGINDVLRWRPPSFAAEVGEALMRTATDGQDGRDAADAVVSAPLPAQIKARLLVALGCMRARRRSEPWRRR